MASTSHEAELPMAFTNAVVSSGKANKCDTCGTENNTSWPDTPIGSSISRVISWPSMAGDQ